MVNRQDLNIFMSINDSMKLFVDYFIEKEYLCGNSRL